MWTHLASLSLSSVVHNGVVVLKSTESHPALKFLIPCILYSLSDHELQPAMWKHSLTTNFPDSCLPGWSTRVVHEEAPLQVPEVMEINNPLLKADPTQRLTVLKPNTSIWGHQIPGRPATGKGPGTRLGSSPAMNSDDSHVCNTPWYIKFDSRQPQAMWKTFFNVCFCGGSWMLFLQRY